MATQIPLLEVKGITKSFPGVKALSDVSFTVERGEEGTVHALLGENGAGKSTLLKILSGAQRQDVGTIEFDGKPYKISSPREANEAGIVTIYQEFNLIPPLSIYENIFSGRELTNGPFINRSVMIKKTQQILDRIGLTLSPKTLVSEISVAEQQMVEIARALSIESKLIIMDEPTSALSETEVSVLLGIVRQIRKQGVSVIFVTHRLKEVIEICDTYTVLRDGQLVQSGNVRDVDELEIIRLMVGREIDRLYKKRSEAGPRDGIRSVALSVRGMENVVHSVDKHTTRLKDVGFEAYYGEILGIGGLVGAGRTELVRMIFGADHRLAGIIEIDGEPVNIRSPIDAISAGIGLLTEDRKQQGCFLDLSVGFNISVVSLKSICERFGFVNGEKESALIKKYFASMNIRASGPAQKIGTLSGGNQQKAILARWLAANPKILIVDEPTRGIDVGAKSQVHEILFELADAGMAIIVISSEMLELLSISDRIVTMFEGRSTGSIEASNATEEGLMRRMSGL